MCLIDVSQMNLTFSQSVSKYVLNVSNFLLFSDCSRYLLKKLVTKRIFQVCGFIHLRSKLLNNALLVHKIQTGIYEDEKETSADNETSNEPALKFKAFLMSMIIRVRPRAKHV